MLASLEGGFASSMRRSLLQSKDVSVARLPTISFQMFSFSTIVAVKILLRYANCVRM
jgi:hypothetical protein